MWGSEKASGLRRTGGTFRAKVGCGWAPHRSASGRPAIHSEGEEALLGATRSIGTSATGSARAAWRTAPSARSAALRASIATKSAMASSARRQSDTARAIRRVSACPASIPVDRSYELAGRHRRYAGPNPQDERRRCAVDLLPDGMLGPEHEHKHDSIWAVPSDPTAAGLPSSLSPYPSGTGPDAAAGLRGRWGGRSGRRRLRAGSGSSTPGPCRRPTMAANGPAGPAARDTPKAPSGASCTTSPDTTRKY